MMAWFRQLLSTENNDFTDVQCSVSSYVRFWSSC